MDVSKAKCSKGQQFETECLRQNGMIMQKHGGLLSVSTTKELIISDSKGVNPGHLGFVTWIHCHMVYYITGIGLTELHGVVVNLGKILINYF